MSIEKLKANYPVKTRWIHFPLHPETPAEGRSLAELFAGRDIEPIRQQLKALMTESGLPYGDRTHTYNSRLAQELGAWGDAQVEGSLGASGQNEALHDALYRAYFVDGKNIGDIETLVTIAGSLDLDEAAAREALTTRAFSDKVDEDWARSRASGVTGVPTFTAQGLAVVGCQPYETLEKFVQHLLGQPRDYN